MSKELEKLRANYEKAQQELEVWKNREQRAQQKLKYQCSAKDRKRTHHLIQYGLAFESHHKELSVLTDDKEKFLRGHESDIILFEAAAKALKASGISGRLPDLAKIQAGYKRLAAEKMGCMQSMASQKSSFGNTMQSSRTSTAFCTPHRGANRKKRCNCRRQSHIIYNSDNVSLSFHP